MVYREVQKLGSVAGNNFFLFTFLMLGQGGAFIGVLLGLLLLFPLSADPLRKIPADRLVSWPLSRRDTVLLRVASVWFSPAAWITVGLLIWAGRPAYAGLFAGTAFLFYALTAVFSWVPERAPALNLPRYVPEFGGPLGGLVRKNVRELLSVLDPYAGLLLAVSGLIYRLVYPHVEADALFVLSLLVVLSLSTFAQCLFGLDTEAGFTRYHLYPLRGWQILVAKDAAFLIVALLLVLPLAPLAGFAGALMAVAVGHHESVLHVNPQARWRFTGGASIVTGIVQVFLMFGAGTMVFRNSPLVLAACVAIWAGSVWWYGRELDRRSTL